MGVALVGQILKGHRLRQLRAVPETNALQQALGLLHVGLIVVHGEVILVLELAAVAVRTAGRNEAVGRLLAGEADVLNDVVPVNQQAQVSQLHRLKQVQINMLFHIMKILIKKLLILLILGLQFKTMVIIIIQSA